METLESKVEKSSRIDLTWDYELQNSNLARGGYAQQDEGKQSEYLKGAAHPGCCKQ